MKLNIFKAIWEAYWEVIALVRDTVGSEWGRGLMLIAIWIAFAAALFLIMWYFLLWYYDWERALTITIVLVALYYALFGIRYLGRTIE